MARLQPGCCQGMTSHSLSRGRLGIGLVAIFVGLSLALVGCAPSTTPSMLDPRGPRAAEIASLWWIMFGLGALVFLVVMGMLLWGLFGRRRNQQDERGVIDEPANLGPRFITVAGAIIPAVIILIVFLFTLRTLAVLAAPNEPSRLLIEVVGYQWWWEVRYPDQQVTTANEIHIPIGRPVEIALTSGDVIHNFWVPQLMGKIDMNPGQTNTVWLEAAEPGVYYGVCAEFCGIQHAKMQFVVVAETEEQFAAWLARQRQPAPEPVDPLVRQGQQIFLGSACIYCHRVAGTNATGNLGPDLTHLASRLTLGAGVIENNRGNLAGWIVNPQTIKPGNKMPATNLSGPELQALLAYLETLQ